MIHFPREALAQELVAALRGEEVFGDAHNGLFLAAPRRTGKSTFLQADLKPALEAAGVVVAYVDLWADPRRDPGSLIAGAIARALAPRLGVVSRAAKAAGLESVTIAGALKIDVSKLGKIDGVTLPDALRALHEAAKAPVALIVDEAQHALTSEAGEATMSALKSARDQLNRPGEVNLMLVMSGSDRDKLLRLVNTNGAPFYGSQISRMPPLGQDFIAHVARLITAQRPELAPVDAATLMQAFESFGHRPQFFMEALGQALSPLSGLQGLRFEQAVLHAAKNASRPMRHRWSPSTWRSAHWSRRCCGACWRWDSASGLTTLRRCASTVRRQRHGDRSASAERAGVAAESVSGAGMEVGPGRVRGA